jgi:hypothetical protein
MVKRKRGRPTNKEIEKRRRAAVRSYLKFTVEDWDAQHEVGDFISHKFTKKCLGMIISKPKISVKESRVTVEVLWYIFNGSDSNEVITHQITSLKKFRPWPGLYKKEKEVEQST